MYKFTFGSYIIQRILQNVSLFFIFKLYVYTITSSSLIILSLGMVLGDLIACLNLIITSTCK